MDRDYKSGVPNPLWGDGEALKKMWEGVPYQGGLTPC